MTYEHHRLIGGDEISKLLGCNPYGNARDLYEWIVNGVRQPFNAAMGRGQRVEPVLRHEYVARVPGVELEPHPGRIQWFEAEWAVASVDDLFMHNGTPGVVDYKSSNKWAARYARWGESGTDQIPEHYWWQLQWYMHLTERRIGHLFVGFGEDTKGEDGKPDGGFRIDRFGWYLVKHDPISCHHATEEAERFWNTYVATKTPPPMAALGGKKPKKSKEARNGSSASRPSSVDSGTQGDGRDSLPGQVG